MTKFLFGFLCILYRVAGWDESEPSLGSIFRVGDQLIKINKQALTSASFAHSIIDSTDDDEVRISFVLTCSWRLLGRLVAANLPGEIHCSR